MSTLPLTGFVSPELIESYQAWTADAVRQMRVLLSDWRQGCREAAEARLAIYEIAHNIKGMGASFEHPLMTEAGRSLAAFLRLKPGAENELQVIAVHIEALERILALGPGDHENCREQLVAPLHRLTGLEHVAS